MAISPKPTADRRHRATPRPWWLLEVALVTTRIGPIAEGQQVERDERGDDGEESEHISMIGHMFSLL
jgi:hypothetical protein